MVVLGLPQSRSRERNGDFMENSNSQISGYSSSIPSAEPPGIRNWFSSYKYESFVLDTYNDFGNSVSRDSESNKEGFFIEESNREREKNVVESGEKRNSYDSCEVGSFPDKQCPNQSFSEIPNSLESASLLSEPPDIRNWFGSYVYESPVLGPSDDFKSSANHRRECEKDGFVIGDSFKENFENSGEFQETKSCHELDVSEIKCSSGLVKSNSSFGDGKIEDPSLCKILDAHNSSSFLSEPPDIKNWFSSYTYESPLLRTMDGFRETPFEEKESEEEKFAVEDSNKEEQEKFWMMRKAKGRDGVNVGENLTSNHSEECTSPENGDQDNESLRKSIDEAGGKGNLCGEDKFSSEKILELSLEAKPSRANGISSHKYVAKSNYEVSKLQQDSPPETNFVSLNIRRSSGCSDRRSSKMLNDRRDITENGSEAKLLTKEVDFSSHEHNLDSKSFRGASLRKPVHRSNDKENEGEAITENGFITTRKNNRLTGKNQENSPKGPQEILVGCSRKDRNITTAGKDPVNERRVLVETTNIQHYENMEITGKWRCPQKNKPDRGPPLKQLRLEQWVRRV